MPIITLRCGEDVMIVRRGLCWLACVLLGIPHLFAAPVISIPLPGGYLDVAAYSGTGPNTAYYVFDFGTNGGGKIAYGYRFSAANLTGMDGMNAFAADSLLTATYSNYGNTMPNLFVNSLAIGANSDNPGAGGGYWSLWNGTSTGSNINWGYANNGLSGVSVDFGSAPDFITTETLDDFLTNGEIYGMRVNYATTIQPIAPVTAIPEPGTWSICIGVGVLAIVQSRRRRVS
jgi:hypothetical protein